MKLIYTFVILLNVFAATTFAENSEFTNFKSNYSRIIGGSKSTSDSWPSTVALLNKVTYDQLTANSDPQAKYIAQNCGGTLIAPNWILTAAHCVVNTSSGVTLSTSKIASLIGTEDLLSGGEIKSIKRVIPHPDFNTSTFDSDIALLELNSGTTEKVISFVSQDIPTGFYAKAVGWGDRDSTDGYNYPSDLYEVDVPIVDRMICANAFSGLPTSDFTDNMICAGYANGGRDTCQGDSGGPLYGSYSNKAVLVGITSWGIGCAQPSLYGVYTRVFNFQAWINSYVPLTALNTAMLSNTESSLTTATYSVASIIGVTAANLITINTALEEVVAVDLPLTVVEIQTLVNITIALNNLNTAMTNNTEANLTLSNYSDAGVTNVANANLAAVNSELESVALVDLPLTAVQIQALVVKAALNELNSAMTNDLETHLTINNYTNVGIVNVTNSNLAAVNIGLEDVAVAGLPLSIIQIQTIVNSISLNALNAAMTNGLETNLTSDNYSNALIVNVTNTNLVAINTSLEGIITSDLPLSVSQIQSLVDEVNTPAVPPSTSSGGGPFNVLLPLILVLLNRRLIITSLRKNRKKYDE